MALWGWVTGHLPAELNIYVDPERPNCLPVRDPGGDGRSGCYSQSANPPVEDTERFRAIGNPVSTIVAELLDFFLEYHKDEKWGFVGAPLHDPCTIAWLLKPELFTSC
ncbi:nucleoside hydrolase [Escherichia coli]